MAEKTQVYHFAPGMPYIPPKDFRLVRAKWESPQLYINGLPAFFHLHLQREDGHYSYAQIFCRPVVNNKQLNIRQIGYVNTSDIGKSLEKMADFHQYQEYFSQQTVFPRQRNEKRKIYTQFKISYWILIYTLQKRQGILYSVWMLYCILHLKTKLFHCLSLTQLSILAEGYSYGGQSVHFPQKSCYMYTMTLSDILRVRLQKESMKTRN